MNWKKINRKHLPKRGLVISGSYRGGIWTTSSASENGWAHWFDSDRTHYLRLPNPPKQK